MTPPARTALILAVPVAVGLGAAAWWTREAPPGGAVAGEGGAPSARPQDAERQERLRERMVREQIVGRGLRDPATIEALRNVPRHEFVLPRDRRRAYGDHPLPIGLGQSISQPYVVAYMTEQVRPRPGMRILEVGTGSGYQAAVLAEAGAEVFTIEIFAELAASARETLRRTGYGAVQVRYGDGYLGWEEEAPFDAIVVTAAAGYVPPPLLEQLRPGGPLIIPVGSVYGMQNLVLVTKDADGEPTTRSLLPVRFVPLLRGLR